MKEIEKMRVSIEIGLFAKHLNALEYTFAIYR